MARDTKYWKRRLGNLVYTSPYQNHMDFRSLPELNDYGLAYYLTGIKGINMLDLNETEITNDAIEMLTKLEYLNELRIKGCSDIDDNCIKHLNKITSIRFLYVKDTKITLNGLIQINALTNLTELLFSVDKVDDFEGKMLLLQKNLPNCRFVVNSVPYNF